MKIVQLVFHLASGGGEKFVVNLSNQLIEMGHEVYLVQLRNDTELFDIHFNRQFLSPQVKYINLNLTKGYSLKKALTVMNAIRKINPDIVHSHLNVLPYYYPLTLCRRNIKFVHTIHNLAEQETSIKWQQKINRFFFGHDFITPVTISDECEKSFCNLYKLPNPKCIDNGCPVIKSTKMLLNVKDEIDSLKQSPDSKVFLHVARYHEQKNQRLLIEAFNKLISDGVDVILLIIGAGFEYGDGEKLKSTACDRIHFLGTRTNIGDYLRNSDFFILSSLWEGLPISLIEAMSAGVTPIATPAGGIPDVINDGKNGFLSPDFSIENFISTIHRALNNPLDRNYIIESYRKSFSMEMCAEKYLEIYTS